MPRSNHIHPYLISHCLDSHMCAQWRYTRRGTCYAAVFSVNGHVLWMWTFLLEFLFGSAKADAATHGFSVSLLFTVCLPIPARLCCLCVHDAEGTVPISLWDAKRSHLMNNDRSGGTHKKARSVHVQNSFYLAAGVEYSFELQKYP